MFGFVLALALDGRGKAPYTLYMHAFLLYLHSCTLSARVHVCMPRGVPLQHVPFSSCLVFFFVLAGRCEGLCYALWTDPEGVPEEAEDVMRDAVQAMPLLLSNRVRALCCERMGRRFDAILSQMPQAVVFVNDDELSACRVNPSAADLLDLSRSEDDPFFFFFLL